MALTLTPQEEVGCFLYLNSGKSISAHNADYFIQNLEPLRGSWPRRNWPDRDVLSAAYKTLSAAYFCKKNYVKAVQLLEDGIMEINAISDHAYQILLEMHQMAGQYYIYVGDKAKALSHFRHQVFYSCLSNTHYNVREFYSFRTVSEHSLKDLRESHLTLGTPENFNDVVDSLIYPWLWAQSQDLTKPEEIEAARLLHQAWGYARIRCFAYNKPLPTPDNYNPKPYTDKEEYSNTLMWSHYTDMHKGFCAKYQFSSKLTHEDLVNKRALTLGEVQYVDSFPMNREKIDRNIAFFTKSKDWEYEHEKRLLYYDVNSTELYHEVSIPEDSLTDIYFGVRCSDNDKQRIIDALKGRNVNYHQMVIDLNDIYRLLAKDYNTNKPRKKVTEKKSVECNPSICCVKKIAKHYLCGDE